VTAKTKELLVRCHSVGVTPNEGSNTVTAILLGVDVSSVLRSLDAREIVNQVGAFNLFQHMTDEEFAETLRMFRDRIAAQAEVGPCE